MTRDQLRAKKGMTRLAGLGMIATLCGVAVLSPLAGAETVPATDANQAQIQQQEAEAARLQAEEQAQAQQAADAARQAKEREEIARQEAEAARIQAEEQAQARRQAEAVRLKAAHEAKVAQEAEAARLKAEEGKHAQQQAEAERLQAEQEAKVKQEAEAARIQAEEQARAQRMAEAKQLKAEQEAKAKQEAEAVRLQAAEVRAKKQAEAERLQAEQQAKNDRQNQLAMEQAAEQSSAEKEAEADRLRAAEVDRLKAEQDAEIGRMNQVTTDTRIPFAGEKGQFFYTKLPISMLHLQMDPADAHLLFYKPPHDKSSFPVKLEQEGEGRVEVKGSFTRRFIKKSLLITLNKGEWQGYKTISLNSMASDASMMREWLAWDMARAMGMAVPKSYYVRLFINNKFTGLFLLTEWISPEMYARSGLGADGELFGASDANFCADLSEKSADPSNKCWSKLKPKDNDFSDLQALAKGIKETPSIRFHQLVDKNFNAESVIDWIALNGMVGNSDTYNKNYFLYRSKQDAKWTVTPWDYDLTYGRNWDPVLPFPHDTMNDNFVYYYSPDSGFPSEFKVKTLENRVMMERLRKRLRHLLGLGKPTLDPTFGWFTPERMWSRIDAIKEEIKKDAQNDPFSANREKQFDESVEAVKYYILARYEYLKNNVVGDDASWVYMFDPNWVQPAYEAQHLSASGSLNRAGDRLVLFDRSNGLMVGTFKSDSQHSRADIKMDVAMYSKPKFLPPGKSASHCIQRNWTLTQSDASAGLIADVTLDYLHEHSKHNELGAAMKDKANIDLWVEEGGKWRALPTEVNTLSKTFTVHKLAIPGQRTMHFAACSNAASNDAAAAADESDAVEAPGRDNAGQGQPTVVEPAKAGPMDAHAARLQAAEEARLEAQQKKDEAARLKQAKADQAKQDAAVAANAKAEKAAEAKRIREEEKAAAQAAKLKAQDEAAKKQAEAARMKAEADAKAQQEAESAHLKSEEEARAKQEAEAARLQAEEQAQQEAQAAKLKAQDEAAQKQAEAARLKAETDAKAQQEAARLKAEEEARAKQEAEAARLQAEEQAQQEAQAAKLKAQEAARAEQEASAARLTAEAEAQAEKEAESGRLQAEREAVAKQEAEAARLQAEEAKAQAQQDAAIAAKLKAEEAAESVNLKLDAAPAPAP